MVEGLSLAVVVAHPDDEAYGMAGSVALHAADPGFRFILVHATDGGAGEIREGFPATRATLGAIRRQEDEAGWRALGRVPDRHVWLGYPDGELDRVPADELTQAVSVVLDEERPTVVATFGPDGVFGHPDHVAIGAATDAAFIRQASSEGSEFRRLLHGAIPDSVFQRWNTQRARLGLPVFDPTRMYHMRGIPDEEIGMTVDCRAVSARIVAGLQQHRSQHHVIVDDAEDTERWKRVVTREWYVIAWPKLERAVGLADIFEGLP